MTVKYAEDAAIERLQKDNEQLTTLVKTAYHEGWRDGFSYSEAQISHIDLNTDWTRSNTRAALAEEEKK